MSVNFIVRLREKSKNFFLLLFQRVFITIEHFNRNGMMNHAAACAYGFLLSAAPALLFVSFVVSVTVSVSHESVAAFLGRIDLLFGIIDLNNLIGNFLDTANSGWAGLIAVISIIWTTRLCAISIQRGLGVIFPGNRSLIKNNIATLGIGLLAMFIIILALLGLRLTVALLSSSQLLSDAAIAPIFNHLSRIVFAVSLALLAMAAYRFFPANPPKLKKLIPGVLCCIIFHRVFNAVFSLIFNPERYNLLYGTLGSLFLFLVNVYFFFVFFFIGAQLIQVLGIFDALLFVRFRHVHSKRHHRKKLLDRFFSAPTGSLKKYIAFYKEGETVFLMNSQGREVYYILSGKAGVYLDRGFHNRIACIEETKFFGEMVSVTENSSYDRAASIKAETDLSVLILPPDLFGAILRIDPSTDKNIIRTLSEQLKSINQQMQNNET